MRVFIAAIAGLAFDLAVAQAQSLPNVVTPDNASGMGAIAVPPAPAIVAAPPSIPSMPVPAAPPPPGLVPAMPPANADNGVPAAPPADADNAANPGQIAPGNTGSVDASPGQSQALPDEDIAPIPPNTWLPEQTARIGVLDKIDGSVSELSIPVGGQSVVGDLQVSVQSCMIRPPDQVPDAAVFLSLQGTADLSAPPSYRGWLVRSAPGAAVAGDAGETFRVIDCK